MRRIILGAAAVAVGLGGGCHTTPKGRGITATPEFGGMKSSELFPVGPEEVQTACREAMADLSVNGIAAQDTDPKVLRTGGVPRPLTMLGKTSDGRPVRVELRPRGQGTVAAVSVGRSGDVPFGRALLDRMGVRLGTRPPAPINEPPSPPPSTLSNPFFSRGAVPDHEIFRDSGGGSGYRDSPSPY